MNTYLFFLFSSKYNISIILIWEEGGHMRTLWETLFKNSRQYKGNEIWKEFECFIF